MESLLKLYRQLLSHLNAEENELAEEFKAELIKYLEGESS
jgi:flagellar biosynthesis regulator FlaF